MFVRIWLQLAKVGLFVLVCFATLLALFFAEENFRGKRAIERYAKELQRKGESLDFATFVPAEVPDEKNFAMTPLLKSLLAYHRSTNGVVWEETNSVNTMASIYVNGASKEPSLLGWKEGTRVDLNGWRDYLRQSAAKTRSGPPTPERKPFPVSTNALTPAADILLALSLFDPQFTELKEAVKRPFSRFPVHYEERDLWGILLPHLARLKAFEQVVTLKTVAELADGRSAEASDDVRFGFRLADACKDEPFLISQIVRYSMYNLALHSIWEGIVDHRWSDGQLADFERILSDSNILAEFSEAMKRERAVAKTGIDYLIQHGNNFAFLEGMTVNGDWPKLFTFSRFSPRGWLYQNEVFAGKWIDEKVLPAIDAKQRRAFVKTMPPYSTSLRETPLAPANFFVKTFGIASPPQKFAKMQTDLNLMKIACALERYRLVHAGYPEQLDALAPQFLSEVPHDIITGTPLHYARTDGGKFVLYSVGWDEKEDGGASTVVVEPPSTDLLNWATDAKETGDWAWRFPQAINEASK